MFRKEKKKKRKCPAVQTFVFLKYVFYAHRGFIFLWKKNINTVKKVNYYYKLKYLCYILIF